MENWKLLILKMDRPSKEAAKFFQRIWTDETITKKIKPYNYIHKAKITKQVKKAAGNLEGKILTIYGHGGFHHYTYGLCNTIAKKRSDDYVYIHIDNHSDSYKNKNHLLDCGSFVMNILDAPKAKRAIFFGNNGYSDEINATQYSLVTNTKRTTQNVLKIIPQQDVYPSLDLDILAVTEIKTGFDQGSLELKHMLNIIRTIKSEKNMISADMLGYESKDKNFLPCSDYTSLLTYAALAAEITGKDTKELKKLHTHFKNKKPSKTLQEEFEKITEGLKI